MKYNNLKTYGLSTHFEEQIRDDETLFLARVCEQHHHLYKVRSEAGELRAGVSGKLMHTADGNLDFPAVGDWVLLDRESDAGGDAVIREILRRKSAFVRKAAGTANATQIVAANIDTVFICMSLNADFNLRRLERYLSVAWDSMATPVIVLTKADLCDDLTQRLAEVYDVSVGTEVIVCSGVAEGGLEQVSAHIKAGQTIAFIGSSGVGKSTLINRLMNAEVLATSGIREDDAKGRHTTTHRELLVLPSGGIVIDTPGMRELQIYSGNVGKTFEDIEELAANCRYNNCTHGSEPGCAVKRAIENGEIAEERFESYQKLQREINYEGLNSRQLENEKINRMFGGKGELKRITREIKKKNHR